jgi:hypothetical protein
MKRTSRKQTKKQRQYEAQVASTCRNKGVYVLIDHPKYTLYDLKSGVVLSECTNGDWGNALKRAEERISSALDF